MSLLQRNVHQVQRRALAGASDVGETTWFRDPASGFAIGNYGSTSAALTLSAVFQGSRLVGEGFGGMPCQLFRRKGENGRERVRGQGLPYLLRWQPTPSQTAVEFWTGVAVSRLLRGIHIAETKFNPRTGRPEYVMPIHPDIVTGSRLPNGRITYTIRGGPKGPRTLSQDEVFVVRGFTEPDGVTPMSVIQYGARSFTTAIRAQKLSATFFSTGGTPSLAVISDDELGPAGIANLHQSVTAYINDRSNAFGVLPLEGGVKLEKLGLTPADAQLATMLNLGVEDIARWLNIPLHMLRYAQQGSGSYASLEVFSAEFVTYTMKPYCDATEQAIQRDLVLDSEKDEIFAEFNMDALMRGDLKSRYEAYRIGIMSGFLKRNEARIKENLDPADGLDEFWTPMNMASTDNSTGGQGDKGNRVLAFRSALVGSREAMRMVMLARESANSLVRKELHVIERLAREQASDGQTWKRELQKFYDTFSDEVAQRMVISKAAAREYCAAHGTALLAGGVKAADNWDNEGVEELALIALGADRAAA